MSNDDFISSAETWRDFFSTPSKSRLLSLYISPVTRFRYYNNIFVIWNGFVIATELMWVRNTSYGHTILESLSDEEISTSYFQQCITSWQLLVNFYGNDSNSSNRKKLNCGTENKIKGIGNVWSNSGLSCTFRNLLSLFMNVWYLSLIHN